jgi:hypothetical protein
MEPKQTWFNGTSSGVWNSTSTHDSSSTFDMKLSPEDRFAQVYFRQRQFEGWLVHSRERVEDSYSYRFLLKEVNTQNIQYVVITDQMIEQWTGSPKPPPVREPNNQGVIDYLAKRAKELIT